MLNFQALKVILQYDLPGNPLKFTPSRSLFPTSAISTAFIPARSYQNKPSYSLRTSNFTTSSHGKLTTSGLFVFFFFIPCSLFVLWMYTAMQRFLCV